MCALLSPGSWPSCAAGPLTPRSVLKGKTRSDMLGLLPASPFPAQLLLILFVLRFPRV